MKKIFIVCLFFMPVFLFAKSITKFNLDYVINSYPSDNSYLIDLYDYNSTGISSVKIIFNANNANDIKIFGNNPENQNWEIQAQCSLRGFSDKTTKYFSNKNCKKWRYFTITPENEMTYNYKIDISYSELIIEVRGKNDSFETKALPKINKANTTVFDIKQYDAEDYLVIRNLTKAKQLMCIPYYYDNKSFKWKKAYENANLSNYNDIKKIEVIDDTGIEDIVYLALEITPVGEYSFKLYERHDDLYIEISETINQMDVQAEIDINFINE